MPGTKPGLLMDTEDAVEREARRRTFWAAFMCVSSPASLRQTERFEVFRRTDSAFLASSLALAGPTREHLQWLGAESGGGRRHSGASNVGC